MAKIVLVDDDPISLRIAEKRLSASGHEVLTASDGKTGLQLVRAEKPQLVLTDLMMPGMHGFSLIQEIRNDSSLSQTQVIVSSGKAYPVDIKKAKELGAAGYLTKPVDPEKLLEVVQSALSASEPDLKVKFWGTRGSIPTPGQATLRYGGNTSCVEVRCGEHIIMLDCGTGAREMGLALSREFKGRPLDIHLFVSHTHWDHIQGFPFFVPAYIPGNRLTIYSLRGADKSLEKIFTGQMDVTYFPVALSDLMAKLNFVELEGVCSIGKVKVSHIYLNHPGLAIGFRIEMGQKSVVYVTDHEQYCRMLGDNEHNRNQEREVMEFARGADLYIREAQYTDEEYPSKKGWGHSTVSDVLESAHEANVRRLALYHHDPMRDDEAVDRIVAACQEQMKKRGMKFSCLAAADNLEITL